MKRFLLLFALLGVFGCTSQEAAEVQTGIERQPNSASSPADAVSNIKNNVQGTLDQIKARDEYQQELAK
ncbi:MAG: hypothetical protein CMJ76_05630 [Planctomycetaceae bacterium]|nr:hypothetical protein [Planctomycetaceae bacterium]|tara:strand:- start:1605 stop:1811 length:207 start_codon:yes stop_codon:yes gene_type:complete